MPSQRNDLKERNANGSKNTRMDFSGKEDMDYRKDELMHIGRYWNAVKTMVDTASSIHRPVRVLDIGCGEMNPIKMFSSSVVVKKSDVISEYIGVDIDDIMARRQEEKHGQRLRTCNAKYHIQDLTVNPHLPFESGYFDCIFCFEFMEHINPKFLPAILSEANRLLSPDGKALFSTPNSNGSNEQLPLDHFYEYSYEECLSLFWQAGFNIDSSMGTCVNITKVPKEDRDLLDGALQRIYIAFGRNTPFSAVASAPLFNPIYCKNVIYHLSKKKEKR